VLVPSLVSLFGSWNWKLPDSVARLLRIQPSHSHDLQPALDD
jgi:RND superfamily putative drug exporter